MKSVSYFQVLVVCSPGVMATMDNWQTMKTKEGTHTLFLYMVVRIEQFG